MQTVLYLLAVWVVLAIAVGTAVGKMIFLNGATEWPPRVGATAAGPESFPKELLPSIGADGAPLGHQNAEAK